MLHGGSFRLAIIGLPVLLLPAPANAAPTDMPDGRVVIRNGRFRDDAERATHWVTRDSGELAAFALLPADTEDGSAVLKVRVREASSRPWTVELRQPIAEPLAKGEVLYITFEYNLTPGYAFHCYWQQDSSPWDKFLSVRLSQPAGAWETCAMAARVHSDLPSRGTSLSLHLAEKSGRLELRNFTALVFPDTINPDSLPLRGDPVFGGDYYDKTWRQRAEARLQTVRTAPLKVTVTRADTPVPEAVVTVRQTARTFAFGTEVGAPFFHANALDLPALAAVRERLAGYEPRLEAYRTRILDRGLFSVVALREALTWRQNTEWGDNIAADVVDEFIQHGMQIRAQSLFCPAFRFAPPACRQMDAAQLRQALLDYVRSQAEKYRGRIAYWDVLHAPLTYEEMYNVMGESSLVDVFKTAAATAPEAKLLLSDDVCLLSPDPGRVDVSLKLIGWLRAAGARIDGLALRASLQRPYIAPQAVENRISRIAEATNLPIFISGLEVESPREQIQADRLRDLLLLFYSHPAVSQVTLAGLWEIDMISAKGALFDRNFAIKPAGKVFEELLTEQWWTNATAKTDANGTLTTAAFLGSHDISVEADGRRVSKSITLTGDGADVALDLAAE